MKTIKTKMKKMTDDKALNVLLSMWEGVSDPEISKGIPKEDQEAALIIAMRNLEYKTEGLKKIKTVDDLESCFIYEGIMIKGLKGALEEIDANIYMNEEMKKESRGNVIDIIGGDEFKRLRHSITAIYIDNEIAKEEE